jgi:hypothetical protein
MQGDGEGLDEGAGVVGYVVGQLVAVVCGVVDEFGEGAVDVGEYLCGGAELEGRADVVAA